MLYVNNNLIKVEKLGLGSIALLHLCIQNVSSDVIWNVFAVIGTVLVLGIQKQRTQTHSPSGAIELTREYSVSS